jgi:hypothetical protein
MVESFRGGFSSGSLRRPGSLKMNSGTIYSGTNEEMAQLARRAGLDHVNILAPQDTNFYQPIIVGTVE